MNLLAEVVSYGDDTVTLRLPVDVRRVMLQQEVRQCELRLDDGRTISGEQRRKIYATIGDIARWSGDAPEWVKACLKWQFCTAADREDFSLSDTDMTTASDFIGYLVDFCLRWNVPCSDPLYLRCDDISRYIYRCVELRICAITGRPGADIHHVDRVGRRKRAKICHIGMRVMPLCREWHDRVHTENEAAIYRDHHLEPIALDAYLVKHLRIGNQQID